KPYGALDLGAVADIGHRDLQPARVAGRALQIVKIVAHTGAREIIENVELGVGVLQQPMSPIRADESCSTKNQHRPEPAMCAHFGFLPLLYLKIAVHSAAPTGAFIAAECDSLAEDRIVVRRGT